MNISKRLIIAIAVTLLLGATVLSYNAYSSYERKDKTLQSSTDLQIEGKTKIVQDIKADAPPDVPKSLAVPANEEDPKEPEIIKYIVKSGDTLESIANTYKIKFSTIAGSNNIVDKDTLKIGQELTFPSVDGVLYKVKNGETLWDLAYTYSIKVNDIVAVNNMDTPDKLKIGQQIILPGVEKLKPETKANTVKPASFNEDTKIASRGGSMWPTRGTITSKFGPRWGTTHKGLDIAAPTGTNVYAFKAGKVIFSGWHSSGYGNLVIIDHGDGLQSYYAHNSKLLVKKGQDVEKGELIAEVGSTGNSTGPHSHFEVRKNGKAVNPYDFLN